MSAYTLATYNATGTPMTFALNDWLGTKRVTTDYAGVVEQTCASLPYGYQLNCTGSEDAPNEQHFTGKVRDSESGNDYFKYRYYSSSVGRWLSPDPSDLQYANLTDPQSLNLYGYVGDDPLTRADLMGLCWKGFAWACDLGKMIGRGFVAAYRWESKPAPRATVTTSETMTLPDASAASNGESQGDAQGGLIHSFVCYEFSDLLDFAHGSHLTVGKGVGGSAGFGAVLGGAVGGGTQIVADPKGNLGVAFNFTAIFPGPVVGQGAIVGGQMSASTSETIYGLRGESLDFSASGGDGPAVGADFSRAKDGTYTGNLTVGVGIGGKGAIAQPSYTWVPSILSTNCGSHPNG